MMLDDLSSNEVNFRLKIFFEGDKPQKLRLGRQLLEIFLGRRVYNISVDDVVLPHSHFFRRKTALNRC